MLLAEPIVKGLRIAGPAFFLGMQGSAVKTAMTIMAEKSVGPLSPFPFVSLLTNCVIWGYYGMLKKDLTVMVPNAIGKPLSPPPREIVYYLCHLCLG